MLNSFDIQLQCEDNQEWNNNIDCKKLLSYDCFNFNPSSASINTNNIEILLDET